MRCRPRPLALLVLAAVALVPAAGAGAAPPKASLRFVERCPVAAPDSARCGELRVPERRDRGADTKRITVRFAVLAAPDQARKRPDPWVFLMGGQGQGLTRLRDVAVAPGLLNRDVLLIEQRGTPLSVPFFGCEGVPTARGLNALWNSIPSDAPQDVRACKRAIARKGADLDGYSTEAAGHDLADLKRLLRIRVWNLFGVSYGGRVALTHIRQHPAGNRSLGLDSMQVPGQPSGFRWDRIRAIGDFFATCRRAARCGRLFGDLRPVFERTVARLERRPVAVRNGGRRDTLTAQAYINRVVRVMYSQPESRFAQLPAAIKAAGRADYAPLLALTDVFADATPTGDPPPAGSYPDARNAHIAQQVGLNCAEEWQLLPKRNGLVRAPFPRGWAKAVRRVAEREMRAMARVCERWGFADGNPAQVRPPVRDDIPTFAVTGDHDPIALPRDVAVLRRGLVNLTHANFPWSGHALSERRQACMFLMMRAFVDAPRKRIDTGCVRRIPEPRWARDVPRSSARGELEGLRSMAANQIADHGFAGRAVHVLAPSVRLDETVAVGFADKRTGRVLTGAEPTRIASTTKPYTTVAILRLAEQGRLGLDDPVARHLTAETAALLRDRGHDPGAITLRQLAHHTSGLPDFNTPAYQAAVAASPAKRWTRREQVAFALDREPRVGAPGARHAYSDTGYVLLGEVIEQATGLDQAAAYRSLLGFDRLGLRSTWFETLEPAPAGVPPRARQSFAGQDASDLDPSFDLFGGGGLVATTRDMAHFLRAVFQGRILERPESLRAFTTVPAANRATDNGPYALGIYRVVVDGRVCWAHAGFWGTVAAHCPSIDVSYAADRYEARQPALNYDGAELLRGAINAWRIRARPSSR